MSKELTEEQKKFHKDIAVKCFNKTWDYIDMNQRTTEDDQTMIQLAHTSRYHWGVVGKPDNWCVGDWQISRVYALLKQPELSLKFAQSSLKICLDNGIKDYQLASAYEGIAKAYSLIDKVKSREYIAKAKKAVENIKDPEDKKLILSQIDEIKN
ncbi:MAG: hypothetical protein ACFFD1_14460 [Candidatus Thorarchaeota archaeon]